MSDLQVSNVEHNGFTLLSLLPCKHVPVVLLLIKHKT